MVTARVAARTREAEAEVASQQLVAEAQEPLEPSAVAAEGVGAMPASAEEAAIAAEEAAIAAAEMKAHAAAVVREEATSSRPRPPRA